MAEADDPELARLGQAFRDELRAEAEEYEVLAARDLLRRRGLDDVARELVHRGDRVAVEVAGRTFAGTVVHAGTDLACVQTPAGVVDVRLAGAMVIRVVERVRSGGAPVGRGARTFLARLREHELDTAVVEVGCGSGALEGRLEAVAEDHVVLSTGEGERCYVATAGITWVRRPV